MKLKIVGGQETSFSPKKIVLMTQYESGGKTLKYLAEHPVGAVFDVTDDQGLALLGQYKGLLKLATDEKITESPRNKMVEQEGKK
jgi:hypothetical protein